MRVISLCLILFLCIGLVSCGSRQESCGEMLTAIMIKVGDLPAGVIYSPEGKAGEERYLSDAMAEALWGANATTVFSLLSDYSVYLSSFAAPYEIGVFICYSSSDAHKIESLCRARADIVSVALRQTEYYALCSNIRIIRRGKVVVFLMTDNPESTVKQAKRIMRRYG